MKKQLRSAAMRTRQQVDNARRAALSAGLDADITAPEWREILAACDNECLFCGAQGASTTLELALAVPAARGGPATKTNCVPTCRSCRSSKGVDDPLQDRYWIGLPPRARERLWAFWDHVGGPPRLGDWVPRHYRKYLSSAVCGASNDRWFTRSAKTVTCDACLALIPPRPPYRPKI